VRPRPSGESVAVRRILEGRARWLGAASFVVAFLLLAGTAGAEPGAPTITEPSTDGQLVHPADVHMEAGGFSEPDADPTDTYACTDWEIRTADSSAVAWQAPCQTGTLGVHIHLGDGAFVNAYAGRTGLSFNSSYVLRARFHDSSGGVSAWAVRSFGTYPPSSPGGGIPWTPLQPGYVIDEVAGGLQLPTNVAFIPEPGSGPGDPIAYVAELYGTIKAIARDGSVSNYASGLLNFNPTGNFPGSGEQGVTGIVVDPASGDVFGSMLYDSDPGPADGPHYPKVVRFSSTDGGRTAATQTTILDMVGETQTYSHQVSNLSIGPDQKLYVHMGDGFYPAKSTNLDSLRGKILRVNLDGTPVPDNPYYDDSDGITARDYIFASGLRNPFGGAWRAADESHYEVENGPSVDRLARVPSGFDGTYNGSDASMRVGALYNWSPAHAPVNIAFVQPETFGGSAFPSSQMDHAFVTESGPTYAAGPQTLGKRIVEFDPDPQTGEIGGHPHTLVEYTGTGMATAAGLAAGPGGLYFTELYEDQNATTPIDPGARLLRIRYGPPTRPTLASTSPPSPANDNSPRVTGIAQFASTVHLYTDPGCRALAATGTSDELSNGGIAVSVPDNTSTDFYASDSVGGANSPCSVHPLTYLEESAPAGGPAGAHDSFNLAKAKRRCRKKFPDNRRTRAACVKRAKRKARGR
jgi:glucose/arabinose dehydrogenase